MIVPGHADKQASEAMQAATVGRVELDHPTPPGGLFQRQRPRRPIQYPEPPGCGGIGTLGWRMQEPDRLTRRARRHRPPQGEQKVSETLLVAVTAAGHEQALTGRIERSLGQPVRAVRDVLPGHLADAQPAHRECRNQARHAGSTRKQKPPLAAFPYHRLIRKVLPASDQEGGCRFIRQGQLLWFVRQQQRPFEQGHHAAILVDRVQRLQAPQFGAGNPHRNVLGQVVQDLHPGESDHGSGMGAFEEREGFRQQQPSTSRIAAQRKAIVAVPAVALPLERGRNQAGFGLAEVRRGQFELIDIRGGALQRHGAEHVTPFMVMLATQRQGDRGLVREAQGQPRSERPATRKSWHRQAQLDQGEGALRLGHCQRLQQGIQQKRTGRMPVSLVAALFLGQATQPLPLATHPTAVQQQARMIILQRRLPDAILEPVITQLPGIGRQVDPCPDIAEHREPVRRLSIQEGRARAASPFVQLSRHACIDPPAPVRERHRELG